ncbi:RdRP-domain-containing protein [Serendipita vermifera]|nr:RdRP-domain-containing protein [Serendipita vermifera]
MEVFMRNIPYGTHDWQLTRILEPILHGPQFRDFYGGAPFNFIKSGLLDKLLVPSTAIGDRLLSITVMNPVYLRSRRIFMDRGKFGVGPDDLILLKEPYQDPAILENEEQRRYEISGEMHLSTVEFGWPCHDDTISTEWTSEPSVEWSVQFDPDTRNCILSSRTGLRALIALRSIHSAALNSISCVFWLERCPIFDEKKEHTRPSGNPSYDSSHPFYAVLMLAAIYNQQEDGPLRNRLVSLDPNYERVFAHSRVVRIIFNDPQSVEEFKTNAKKIGLPLDGDYPRFERRELFSPVTMELFDKEFLELRHELISALDRHLQSSICARLRVLEQRRDEHPEASALSLFNDLINAMERDGQAGSFLQPTPDLFHCHRVVVTPTSFILHGPLPDETNRVIRKYPDNTSNFIRVEFREEDRLQFRWDDETDGNKFIDERVGNVLKEGIVVAGRKFEFLAYSSSALRKHAVWFMAQFTTQNGENVIADSIRASLGDFTKVIYCPARYGARISQAFSSKEDSVSVEVKEMIRIEDVTYGEYIFTDGIGCLSLSLAEEVWEKYTETRSKRSRRRLQTPSAFQIGLGGLKGILCVDEPIDGRQIYIRDSMEKFESDDHMIEIARAFDRPMLMYLNRYLIMVLETLGVPLQPFMELQKKAVEDIEDASKSLDSAARLLEPHGLGTAFRMTSIMLNLHRLEVDLNSTDRHLSLMKFLRRTITFSINRILRDLKYKARIPVEKAWTLVGVADEWNYLKEDEVFAYVCTIDGHKEYLEGPVMISRAPTVHPGDARMVRAIGKPVNAPPSLTNLTNCVVFSCKGRRPLPSMLAGGDLDGDIYCLVMDESLFPRRQVEPGSYKPPKRVELDRPAKASDIADFVVNYIKNDLLGVIATRLLLNADISSKCMEDENCLELAALHSVAVDFPKTGRPVERGQLPPRLAKTKPDWFANETTNLSEADFYPSERHIGHLFRAIKLPAVPEAMKIARRQQRLLDDVEEDLDVAAVQDNLLENDCLITRRLRGRMQELGIDVQIFLENNAAGIIAEILDSYERYSVELSCLYKSHSLSTKVPLSEEEIVAGTIVAKCAQPRMRQDYTSAMRREATSLCETIREEIEGSEETSYEDTLQRAWVAWKVALAYSESFGAKSFGLLALDVMFSTFREMIV